MNPQEQLDYVSSAPTLVVDEVPRHIDEAEMSTMLEVLELCVQAQASYNSNSSLSLDPTVLATFSVEQQLAINNKVMLHIQTLTTKIQTAISKVKEKQNGREY